MIKITNNAGTGDVVIYQDEAGNALLDVRLDGDTVWLTRHQLAVLYGRDIKTIAKHINNALKEELSDISVGAKFATTAADGKTYQTEHFNLDMVLSIGYRVKSNEGIRFRRWATEILHEHLIKGYTINEKRLAKLNQMLEIVSRANDDMVSGVANILQKYADGLEILDDYDYQRVAKPNRGTNGDWELTYSEARAFIDSMRFSETSNLFGNEKDESFQSSLGAIYQSFGGQDIYPTVQEKAANLLYLVVKNHSFSDGNKRIAAALFVYFLDKNHALYTENGLQIIANNALAAMTLMVALSKPAEKEIICALIMNMLEPK